MSDQIILEVPSNLVFSEFCPGISGEVTFMFIMNVIRKIVAI